MLEDKTVWENSYCQVCSDRENAGIHHLKKHCPTRGCNHLVGTSWNEDESFDTLVDWAMETYYSLASLDERFKFCPRCGVSLES